ncbi:hypothetical protein [Streptomyces sp. Ag82_G6-1]|uniref:hypothetical protein n=1 Tax=Streptomyces sp. Ag82_G6-1 TaxID=1938853 RepID=UPI000C7BDBDE
MTAHDELRLLPWAGPDGKPCYLSTDDQGGYVSRLADHIEAFQLGLASQLSRFFYQLSGEVCLDHDREEDHHSRSRSDHQCHHTLRNCVRPTDACPATPMGPSGQV